MKHILPLIVMIALFGHTLAAHHSRAAAFILDRTEVIEGTVVQVSLREPHSFLHVTAPDQDGVMRRWSAEWDESSELVMTRLAETPVRVGDQVRVVAHPGRTDGAFQLLIIDVTRLPSAMSTRR